MTTSVSGLDHHARSDRVAAEIVLLAEAIRRTDADTPVPSCPGWTAQTLATHIGMIHRWVRGTVLDAGTEPLEFTQFGSDLPQEWKGYGDWLEASSGPLSSALREADPSARAWSFADTQNAGFWSRRMLHETAIHRVDAELAAGQRPRMDTETAVDGIDELLYMLNYAHPFRAAPADLRGQGESIHLHATDAGLHWLVRLTPDGHVWKRSDADEAESASATLRGNADDIHLYQYNRLDEDTAGVERTGDQAVLADWLARSAL